MHILGKKTVIILSDLIIETNILGCYFQFCFFPSLFDIDCLVFQYMLTHGTKRAEIDFFVFLTILEYAESNAERCQAQIFM